MASTSKEVLNESMNSEVDIPCIKCSGRTSHEVVVSVDKSGHEPDFDWYHAYQIIRCKGCKTLSYREVSATSDDYVQIADDDVRIQEMETLFPPRIEGRKDLGDDVMHLPLKLRKIYHETVNALANDSPILVGIGLRAIVETICKEKNAAGKDLYEKINDLESKQVLMPSGAKILHKIRSLGNDAAHEVKPHTLKQLSVAMGVVEHMLKDVYVLPTIIEEVF